MSNPGLLLIISGPSGVGKTTIAHSVELALGGTFSVSVTTRPKTDKDTEGVDYLFVDQTEFRRQKEAGELLECAEVFGHWYGTPRAPVAGALAAGKLMILEIDIEGTVQVKKHLPQAFAIFLLPPSDDELLQRLRRRKRDTEQVIQRRFAKAKDEMMRSRTGGAYDAFVINDDLNFAIDQTIDLVRAEWAGHNGKGPRDRGTEGPRDRADHMVP